MPRKLEVFVATKGHAFCRDGFEAMLRAVGVEPTFVDQPAAATLMNPQGMARFDALLLYDMPGMDFRAAVTERPGFVAPPPAFREGFLALLRQGKGIVALHHALAGWPAWPGYAEALGGAFLYKPRALRGRLHGGSGYLPDARYTLRTLGDHPVLAGLPGRFELEDELYACERLPDPGAVPLIMRESPVDAASFLSAMHAVRREGQGDWRAPANDAVLGWARAAHASPLVYLQPGDGPQTYENPNYRLLLGNALRWVASPQAREWAAGVHAGESAHG